MATWFVKRCLWALLLALVVATSIFAIVNLLPGDPITLILGRPVHMAITIPHNCYASSWGSIFRFINVTSDG